ncbi:MAG: DUF4231 domain-containing protein [Armatimonadetes bacterium]|nr:DUF4231 domain-containing protein [Anaerolineae bacterium]
MATTPEATPISKLNTDVLLQAWARMSVYDQTASHLKNNFIRRRNRVVDLTLTATVTAVLAGIVQQPLLAGAFALLSIVLPVVATYQMNDIMRFTGTTTWVKYRYIAETMRMHIFLYRMQAGDYAEGPAILMDDRLGENLSKIRDEIKIDEAIPFTVQEPIKKEDIVTAIARANRTSPIDTGLDTIEMRDYLQWRLINQRQWYDERVDEDYRKFKFDFRLSQSFFLSGAILSALIGVVNVRVIALVANTNAISVAITTRSNVSMFGKTYSLFHVASLRLGNQLRDWYALQDNPEMQHPTSASKATAQFVADIEATLKWERDEWFNLAIQIHTSNDHTILNSLQKLTASAPHSADAAAMRLQNTHNPPASTVHATQASADQSSQPTDVLQG